jgi:5-methylcytosine-specific restriction endonuclease McrA
MPIKPENAKRYPANWKHIRFQVLQRAGLRCENCGVHNHDIGWRDDGGNFHIVVRGTDAEGSAKDYAGHATGRRVFQIVLTVAHLDHVPENCDLDNLRAWCQKCHLTYDAKHHAQNAHHTRKSRKAMAELF